MPMEATTSSSEELLENIIHILMSTTTATTLLLLSYSLFSKLVIGASFVWITQGLIGICNFLEFYLCSFRIILVLVWMVLNSKFLEFLLDLCIRSISLNSQDLVVIFSLFLGLLLLALSLLTSAKSTPSETSLKTALSLSLPVLPLGRYAQRWAFITLKKNHRGDNPQSFCETWKFDTLC